MWRSKRSAGAPPRQVLLSLLTVLAEVSKGNAISIVPHHQELSTQKAAEILKVSRPYLVGLLEKGAIPHRHPASRRSHLLPDRYGSGVLLRGVTHAAACPEKPPFSTEEFLASL